MLVAPLGGKAPKGSACRCMESKVSLHLYSKKQKTKRLVAMYYTDWAAALRANPMQSRNLSRTSRVIVTNLANLWSRTRHELLKHPGEAIRSRSIVRCASRLPTSRNLASHTRTSRKLFLQSTVLVLYWQHYSISTFYGGTDFTVHV